MASVDLIFVLVPTAQPVDMMFNDDGAPAGPVLLIQIVGFLPHLAAFIQMQSPAVWEEMIAVQEELT